MMHKIVAVVGLVAMPSAALALTSKERGLWTVAGGCAFGGGVVAYMDSQNPSERKSTAGTIGMSAAVGCLSGAVFSWFFMDDDQAALARDNDNLRTKLAEYDVLLRSKGKQTETGERFEDTITSGRISKDSMPADLSTLVNQGCRAVEFRLGFDMSGNTDVFLPVNGQVAIQAFKYYLIVPEDGSDRDCVKPHPRFGFLEKEVVNLGEILISKGVKNGRVQ